MINCISFVPDKNRYKNCTCGHLQKLREFTEMAQQRAIKPDESYGKGYDDYWQLMGELSDTNKDKQISR